MEARIQLDSIIFNILASVDGVLYLFKINNVGRHHWKPKLAFILCPPYMLKYVFIAILRLPIVVTPLLRASMKIPWLGNREGSGILDLRDTM